MVFSNTKKVTSVIILLVILLVIFLSSLLAEDKLMDEIEKNLKELEGQVIPGPAGILFGNEKFNIHLKLDENKEIIYGIVTENKKIKSINIGGVKNPSINAYVDKEVLTELQNSENPLAVIKKALDEKKITYEIIGFFNKIKFGFISLFVDSIKKFSSDNKEKGNDPEEIKNELKSKTDEIIKEEITAEKSQNTENTESITSAEELDKVIILENDVNESLDQAELNEELNETGSQINGSDETEEAEETVEDIIEDEEVEKNKIYIVEMNADGFNPDQLTIKVGDTVVWKNVRSGSINKAIIIGTMTCLDVKSGIFNSGENFTWTFDKADQCTIVDGIMTTQTSKITIQ